jgi:hypothetical protein
VKQGLHQKKQSCSSVTHAFSFQPIIYSVCTNSLGTISAGKFIGYVDTHHLHLSCKVYSTNNDLNDLYGSDERIINNNNNNNNLTQTNKHCIKLLILSQLSRLLLDVFDTSATKCQNCLF